MIEKVDTILWDIDGTLLDFTKSERFAIKECFSHFGLGLCGEDLLQEYSEINTRYWTMLEKGELTKPEVLHGRFEEFFSNHGIDTSIIDEFNHYYQGVLGENPYFHDGAKETVTALRGRFRQYIVTNGTLRTQKIKIEKTGFGDIFDGVFISDEIGYEKPAREFFECVEKSIGVSDPKQVMIVGDSLYSDIKGGSEAGYVTCWFNCLNKERKIKTRIDLEIRSIPEILDILL